uniref:Reverse transcriptase/retrotransposon-derived protein RNase H-like domain-containing protein n=1 Tax=Anas zonorhyncha TaxID=75864 RepID=A0A8B9VZI6_9AVES
MQDLRTIIIQGIRESVPRGQNINKAFNEQQKKDKTPTEWLKRLRKSLQLYSGLDPGTPVGEAFLKTQFDGLLKWTKEDEKQLEKLKEDLAHPPVLSLPDLRRPFFLFVNSNEGTAYGVLAQEWAGSKKPVAYLSKLLDVVSQGWPSCLQVIVAAALLVEEAQKITFGGEIKVISPHNIWGVLQILFLDTEL